MSGGFTRDDRVMWQKFRVSRELLERFGVKRVSDAEARALGIRYAAAASLDGLWFPYLSFADPDKRVGARLRRDLPEIENDKPKGKYLSTYGDRRHLYFPRDAKEKLRDPATAVVLVEAEKSVIALTAWAERVGQNILPVGTGGCYGWHGPIGKVEDAHGQRVDEKGPLPDLITLCQFERPPEGREFVVMLDSNIASNHHVRTAEYRLVETLIANGARPRVARIPVTDGINGPDDLVSVTNDADFELVLTAARPTQAVVLADAEIAIEAVAKADKAVKTGAMKDAVEVLSQIDDSLEREGLAARLADAVRGLHRKQDVLARVTWHFNERRQERAEQTRQVKDATAPDVDGAKLLQELEKYFTEHAYLPDGAALLLAHYVVNTWTFQIFDSVPYLLFESAVPRCGKSTMIKLTAAVSCRPRMSNSLTEATLFRLIDKESPTLFVDEAETVDGKSDRAQALQAVANEGYKAGSEVPRCQGENFEIVWFRVFGPKIFAAIGGLSGALLDRCLVIHMERAPKGHKRQSCRMRAIRRAAKTLVEKLEAYAARKTEALRELYDREPDEGYWPSIADRESELWGPLLIHARLSGEEMETRFLKVAASFGEQKEDIESVDWRIAQTIDLADAIRSHPDTEFIPSDLVDTLLKSEAWAKPLSKAKGSNEEVIKVSRAAKIGYFLTKFRIPKAKKGDRHYNCETVLQHLNIYAPLADTENPAKPAKPAKPNPVPSQATDNTGTLQGSQGLQGFTEGEQEGISDTPEPCESFDLFSDADDHIDDDDFVEGNL